MYKLQDIYSLVLNPVGTIIGRIDERIRNAVITLCCLFLASFFIAYYDCHVRFGLYLNHTHNNVVCGTVLIILVIFSIKAPLKHVEWDPVLFYSFFAAGAGIVIISLIHPVGSGYRSFGLMMMFGFPCLYYVWNNRGDYNTLYKRLSGSTAVTGLFFAAYCVRAALAGELVVMGGLVSAFFFNPNLFSMVGMAMVCSSIYMFATYKESTIGFLFASVSFASGWSIIMLGGSRLSVLVGAGGIVSLLIYSLKTEKKPIPAASYGRSYIRSLAVVVMMIGALILGSALLRINNSIQQEAIGEESFSSLAANETAAIVEAVIPADTVYAADETTEDNVALEKFSTEGKDLDAYTSGRVTLWRNYARHLNLLGNDFSKVDFVELTGSYVQHAHNNFLEYAYRCGVPVACLHIFLELYAGIICIIFLFGKKYRDPYYLFAIVFMICYALESMFDIATLPFERHAPFYFYMALIPVFGKKVYDKREQQKQETAYE